MSGHRRGRLRNCCSRHADVYCKCQELNCAVFRRNLPLVNRLVSEGANVNNVKAIFSPIVMAASNWDVRMCLALLNHGADLNMEWETKNGSLTSPLGTAIVHRTINAVTLLLALGARVDSNRQEQTPRQSNGCFTAHDLLHLAVHHNDLTIFKELVKAGGDVDVRNSSGETVLQSACRKPSAIGIVHYIIDHVPCRCHWHTGCIRRLNCTDACGRTALMQAVSRLDTPLAAALLVAGADPDVMDVQHETALHYACRTGDERLLLLLLRAGAACNCPPLGHCTPLMAATAIGDLIFAEIFLDFGADVNAANGDGETALHLAVQSDNVEWFQLFLEAGADIDERTMRGNTALKLAAERCSADVCGLLIDYGALLNYVDTDGTSALAASIRSQRMYNTRLLIAAGAHFWDGVTIV